MGIVFVITILLLNPMITYSDCSKLTSKVKSASQFVLGIDFPYWYNVGQIEAESNCMWRTSLDGWGSIGYAQITPKFWDSVLSKYFPNWKIKDSTDYFLSHAYIVKNCFSLSYCNKLWNAYQCYNRSCNKVNREAKEGKCVWADSRDVCQTKYSENVCVLVKDGKCVQYRTSCDVNYTYGWKVYRLGKKYSGGIVEFRYVYF